MSTILEKSVHIKQEKDTKIIPENIKKDVQIFDVTGTFEGEEDLEEVVSAQEEKITEIEEALRNKAYRSEIEPNIYAQEEAPADKEGIWIKTSEEVEGISFISKIFENGTWSPNTQRYLEPIPNGFSNGAIVTVGTKVYMFGGNTSSSLSLGTKRLLIYDVTTNSFTTGADMPESNCNLGAVAKGNKIYVFGGRKYSTTSSYTNYIHEYDIETDTYTQLANLPTAPTNAKSQLPACIIGDDIYLFPTDGVYKYNITNQSGSKVNSDSKFVYYASVIGTKIYAPVDSSSKIKFNVFDTESNTWSQTSTEESGDFGSLSAIAYGSDVYVLCARSQYTKYCYKYDTLTDTFTQLTDPPYDVTYTHLTIVESDKYGVEIYTFGGRNDYNPAQIQALQLQTKQLTDKNIVVSEGTRYKTQFYTNSKITGRVLNWFDNAYYYTTEGGLNLTIPKYYGNGTQWIQFGGEE